MMVDPIFAAVGASVLSAGLTGLVSSTLTASKVAAVMDQKVSDVTRRVTDLEAKKLDLAVADVQHGAIVGKIVDVRDALEAKIETAFEEISRERHRVNNLVQGQGTK